MGLSDNDNRIKTEEVTNLLTQLNSLNIQLTVEQGGLRYNAPKGSLTLTLRKRMAACKQEIITLLGQGSDPDSIGSESPIPLQPRNRGMPLSTAQQRFWFLDQLDHGNSPAFNMPPMVMHLQGRLNVAALHRALNEIIQRHGVLRTAFFMDGDQPIQMPVEHTSMELPLHDLRTLDHDSQQKEMRRLIHREAATPFDLKKGGPLLRVVLVQTGDQDHYFILTMHHLISDGWSLGIFLQEITSLYRSFINNSPCLLPKLPIQYVDYAHWERRRLRESCLQHHREYWLKQLKNAPTLLELPTDHPRPRIRRNVGRSEHFHINSHGAKQLHRFCRNFGLTPYMALVSAFGVLLCRHTGQEDIVIGSPIALRPHSQTEPLMGLFLNTLALRLDIAGNPSFSQLAQQVKKTALEAYEYSEFPFDMLLQELKLKRSLNHTPLFQVLFALQNAPMGPVELEGLTITPMPVEELHCPFDLVLSLEETNDGITGKFRYNTDLFEAPTIVRLTAHYQCLVKQMLRDPAKPVRHLPMLSSREMEQLNQWQGRKAHHLVTKNLVQLFERVTEQSPHAIAVTFNGDHVSYQELNRRANCLAHALLALKGVEGSLVGLCLERSVELVVGILAVLKAGAAYVPLNPALPPQRLQFIIEDARVKVVVAPLELLPGSALKTVTCIDPSKIQVAHGKNSPSFQNPAHGCSPESTAYVIYTSGSTGDPKGVQVTHGNVVRLFTGTEKLFNFTCDDVWTLFHSFAFDFSVWELWGALLYGGRLVVVPHRISRCPNAFHHLLATQGVTVLNQTPSAFRQLAATDRRKKEVSLALKWVIFGGEALKPRTLQSWVQRHGLKCPRLINMYGITETTVHATFHCLSKGDIVRGGSPMGIALPDLSLHIVDPFGQLVPIGVAGEILVGGAGVAKGYLNRPQLTAKHFVEADLLGFDASMGPMYRSGDLARWRPEGILEYVGRMDQQVKIRGFRIEPGEIEACLTAHLRVREAVVQARTYSGTTSLVAYVTLEKQITSNKVTGKRAAEAAEELRDHLAQQLPDYMVPASVTVIPFMPLTPNGKMDFSSLPEPHKERPDLKVKLVLPATPLQSMLAGLWSDILNIRTIGVDDNFFKLGGDSIKGVIFTNKLQERIGSVVHVTALFEAPTIRELSAYLHRHHPGAAKSIDGITAQDVKHGSTTTRKVDHAATTARSGTRTMDEGMVARLARAVPHSNPVSHSSQGPRNPRAIFILSPPRSGSTLLRVMLAGHPQLFAPPELELLPFNTLNQRREICSGQDSLWLEGTLRALMELHNIDADSAKAMMAKREARGMSVKDFYGEMQQWLGNAVLVDKSPSYALNIEVLQRAEAYFDNALYIHLHRHPCGMIQSFEEVNLHQIFFRHAHDFSPCELAEVIWVQSHRNILRFLATIPASRWITMDFARLTSQPRQSMEQLCGFMEICYMPEMLNPCSPEERQRRMTNGIHKESRMLGDIKFHTHRHIDPLIADRWKGHYHENFLGEPARHMALSLGYPPQEKEKHMGHMQNKGLSLSFAQQRLWFLDQLKGAGQAYNMPMAVRVHGPLKPHVLAAGLRIIARRHEALRTCFEIREGLPAVHISPEPVKIRTIDLSGMAEHAQAQQVDELSAKHGQTPFDLTQGPLFRTTLVILGNETFIILVNMHHIVSDGWSMEILIREWGEVYSSLSAQRPPDLPRLTFQYVDYARRQQCRAAQGGMQQGLDYWKNQLRGAPALLELPTDRPRPPMQRFCGDTLSFDLTPEMTRSLKDLVHDVDVSLFMLLLGVFGVMMMRYSGQEDVVIGSPCANRTTREVEPLVGFFVNTLPMRLTVEPELPFAEFLCRVRSIALKAYTHQEIPFEKIVEELKPHRDLSYSPIFQVMFSMQNPSASAPALEGLKVTVMEQGAKVSKYDLTLTMVEGKAGLHATFEFNTDLFDKSTVQRMAGHFTSLLKGIIADLSCPLNRLPLITPAEYCYLTREWNRTRQTFPGAGTIHGLFEAQVQRTPNAAAVQFENLQLLTYRELNGRVNRLARHLRNMGASNGTMVAVVIERSLDMLVGLLAILKVGATYVPLDPNHPKERTGYIFDSIHVDMVLTWSALQPGLPEHKGQTLCLDRDRHAIQACSKDNLPEPVNPDTPAYVIFTSGSTGNPKGVMIPHRAAVNFLNSMGETPGMGPYDRLLAVTTISFDIAVLELYLPLTVGARVVIAGESMIRDGDVLMETIEKQGITVMQATPATWRLLLFRGWQGSPFMKILCGGEALTGTLAARLLPRSASLWNLYGPTETTVWSTLHRVTNIQGQVAQPIGRPIGNTRLYILDKALNPVPVGVPGELYIGGTGVAQGYWKRPDLTTEKFIPDPFAGDPDARMYCTGDLARHGSNSAVEYLGRTDHQIKLRGFRIELGEIEHALSNLPGVEVAAVVAEKGSEGIKRLVAFFLPEPGHEGMTHASLQRALCEKLPDYMVPGLFVQVEEMPLTPNGKINRQALCIPHGMEKLEGRIFAASRDTLELELIRIWEDVLEVRPIGIRDNFFDLGGHSFIAVRLMAHIMRHFNHHLPLSALFQGPTVEAMACLLRRKPEKELWSSLVPIQPKGTLPPLFSVPGAGGNVIYFHDLAREMGRKRPFYGLQPPGLDGITPPHNTVEDLAGHYISVIREVQPQGPYLLGGHSFGGLVAFEMFRQLKAQQEEIKRLIIMDTPAPKFFQPTGGDWNDARWLAQVAEIAGHQYGVDLQIEYSILQALTPEEQPGLLHQRLKECEILPPEAKLVHFQGFMEVYKNNLKAHYNPIKAVEACQAAAAPRASSGAYIKGHQPTLTLIRSRDEQPENIAADRMEEIRALPDLGWKADTSLNVQVVEAPGDHLTMLQPPHVALLAALLQNILE